MTSKANDTSTGNANESSNAHASRSGDANYQADNASQSQPLTTSDISTIVTSIIKALSSNISNPTPSARDPTSSSPDEYALDRLPSGRHLDHTEELGQLQLMSAITD